MILLSLYALLAAAAPAPPAAADRVLNIGVSSSERLKPLGRLAPGAPPLLAFRYIDGRRRHRFGDMNLLLDDAGH